MRPNWVVLTSLIRTLVSDVKTYCVSFWYVHLRNGMLTCNEVEKDSAKHPTNQPNKQTNVEERNETK